MDANPAGEVRTIDRRFLTIPEDVDPAMLAPEIRAELRSLSKPLAATVARHLIMAGRLVDDDPELALAHAREARRFAARIGVVREAAGITAYRAGEWAEALTDLRAAQRLTGDVSHLPLLADSERALGRPERALRIAQSDEVRQLDAAGRAELRIVAAGARRDLGEFEAALLLLRAGGVDRARVLPWSVRLWYAYADTLLAAGRVDEAADWFLAVTAIDLEGETDAEDRLVELGVLEPVADDVEADADEAVDAGAADTSADVPGPAHTDLETAGTDQAEPVGDEPASIADEPAAPLEVGSDETIMPTDSSTELLDDETVVHASADDMPEEPTQLPTHGTFSDQVEPQPCTTAVSNGIPQVSISAAEEPVSTMPMAPPPVSTGSLFQEPVAEVQSPSISPDSDSLSD